MSAKDYMCPFVHAEGPCRHPPGHSGDHEWMSWDEWEAKEAKRRAEREERRAKAGDSSPCIVLPDDEVG